MGRAEMRRVMKENKKKTATFLMTKEQLNRMIKQEHEKAYIKAKEEFLQRNDEIAEKILKKMIVIPTNVLINDYWEKTARKKIPKFVDDCLSLYESLSKGIVDMRELQALTEEYAHIKLIDSSLEKIESNEKNK